MTITCICSFKNPSTGVWRDAGEGGAKLGAKVHAERQAYEQARARSGGATHFRFDQNAFPCHECTDFFARESMKGLSFEFVCSANIGSYAIECGFLPRGDARNFSADTVGTLKIVGGEARGLYGSTVLY